ncbi:MAG TPA: gliding motility-associated C-terminal domain-containing protein [Bacteroidia bacterium]|nr:gliding motility-associated C-terminal domain-containing protein [Bacteroidia bacterium]
MFRLILMVAASLITGNIHAQTGCVQIRSILVDACGNPEWDNEMVRFEVGANPVNTNSMNVSWPTTGNPFLGICQTSGTTSTVNTLNASITGCGHILQPTGGVLPAHSKVLLVTSTTMNPTYNSFANLQDTIYMIFQCPGNSAGHFKNFPGNTPKTLTISFSGSCSDAVTYIPDSLTDVSGNHVVADGASVDFDVTGNATYINYGCQAPINPLSTTVTTSATSGCAGTVFNVNAVINSGSYVGYFWSGGHGTFGTPSALGSTYQSSTSFTGVEELYFGVITNCNDTVYDTLQITINPGANLVLNTSGPTTFCQGDSVVLTASGAAPYLWSTGATTASITVLNSGTYTVTGTSSCGAVSASQTITVNSVAVTNITASGPTTFCAGGNVDLTASGATTYLWSTGATTATINITSAGTYTVTGTSSCGTANASQTITINPLPTASILAGGPTTFCTGNNVTLTASGGSSYLWSTGATTAAISPSTSNTYTVTVTNSCGSSTASQQVIELPLPTAFITVNGGTTICQGQTTTLIASGLNGSGTFQWSTGVTADSIVVSAAGIYTVTNTNSCGSSSYQQTISVTAIPVATITTSGPTTFCQGQSVVLSAPAGMNYVWSDGSTASSINVSSANLYTVTVSNNCGTSTASQSVTVNPLPQVSTTVSGPLILCNGDSAIITATGNNSFLWSTGETTASITVHNIGTYTVSVTNSCGTSTSSQTFTLGTLPSISITGSDGVICNPGVEHLEATGIGTFLWSTGATGSTINVNSAGVYVVTATNSCGSNTDSITITPSTLVADFTPSITTGPAPLTVTFFNQSQNAALYNWAFGNVGTSPLDTPEYTFTNEGIYNVVLTAEDGYGCIATHSDTIYVLNAGLYVPNVFTPNNDDRNEEFNVSGTGITGVEGSIINRWGDKIATWNSLTEGWKGVNFDGDKTPEGVYYYIIKVSFANTTSKKLYGTVTLLR